MCDVAYLNNATETEAAQALLLIRRDLAVNVASPLQLSSYSYGMKMKPHHLFNSSSGTSPAFGGTNTKIAPKLSLDTNAAVPTGTTNQYKTQEPVSQSLPTLSNTNVASTKDLATLLSACEHINNGRAKGATGLTLTGTDNGMKFVIGRKAVLSTAMSPKGRRGRARSVEKLDSSYDYSADTYVGDDFDLDGEYENDNGKRLRPRGRGRVDSVVRFGAVARGNLRAHSQTYDGVSAMAMSNNYATRKVYSPTNAHSHNLNSFSLAKKRRTSCEYSTSSNTSHSLFSAPPAIGGYTPQQREAAIERYLEKRKRRVWTKKIKYSVRKTFADSRLRVKGRFVSKEDEQRIREGLMLAF